MIYGTGRTGGIGGIGEDGLFQLKTCESLYAVRVLSRLRPMCCADVVLYHQKTASLPHIYRDIFACYVFSIF